MKELRNEKVISYATVTQPNLQILELCRRNGIVLDAQFVDMNLVVELCSTGRFVALSGLETEGLQDVVAVAIEGEEIFAEIHLLVNRRSFINQAAETFIGYAKEKLAL
jgi:hypothetical protein